MWGKQIIEGTLRHIFQHNFEVDHPGGMTWSIKPRKPHKRILSRKQYNRVISFLRRVLSWNYRIELNSERMSDCGVLSFFIKYMERNHNDLFVYKTYEEYEF